MYQIRHEFYEAAHQYPIMVHVFQGETLDETLSYFRAHRNFDRTLASSSTWDVPSIAEYTGLFQGVKYRSVVRIVGPGMRPA